MKRQERLIVQEQKNLFEKALSGHESTVWKIIVFDVVNRNILSSQFKMKDLRDHNITLYLNIKEEREQLHGVTIVYFVQPTLQNVELISNDLFSDLYSSVVVHFSSQPTPNILSTLAKTISSKKPTLISRITRIQYSCLAYYSIDNNMVILPSEVQIVNFFMSMKLKPIFIYNSGDQQCERLAQKTKIKLQSKRQQMQKFTYGIIYLYNRENDYFPVLSHGINYSSLIQNIYKYSKIGNKVIKSNKESYELSLTDEIWVSRKNMNISEMYLEKEFNKIKSKMINLSQEEFTQYNERSKKIQWHINNAQEMLKQAKRRRLNQFYEIELEIYNKKALGKDQLRDLLQLLQDSSADANDKVRIILLYITLCEHLDELQNIQNNFPDVKKNNKYNEIKLKRMKESTGMNTSGKYIKKFAKGLWTNLVASEKKFPLTKDIEKIKKCEFAELRQAGLIVDSVEEIPPNVRVSHVIAHCLGGACFHEYSNINKYNPDIIYSGSELINYSDVL